MGTWLLLLVSLLLLLIVSEAVIYKVKQKKRIMRKEIDHVRKDRGW